jgi:hypothetical protein
MTTNLEKHELIQWVVPLHKENTLGRCPAQILVAVVWITADATLGASLGVGNF